MTAKDALHNAMLERDMTKVTDGEDIANIVPKARFELIDKLGTTFRNPSCRSPSG